MSKKQDGLGFLILAGLGIWALRRRGGVAMGQENEWGFALCRYPNGQITHGRVTSGTPTSVKIDTRCPEGTTFLGMAHSHPGGVAYPSSIDVNAMRRSGAEKMCIVVPERDEVACYKLKRP